MGDDFWSQAKDQKHNMSKVVLIIVPSLGLISIEQSVISFLPF